MTVLLMQMDENVYPEPQVFNPERWMNAETRRKADRTYAPFSRGTRVCLGMQLGWAELYMTVAALAQRFDFTLEGAGPKDVVCASDQFIIGTEDSSGLKLHVSKAAE
ncbi:cytochrome P450 [Ophiobolus disseminans]|uniref:Cytochrome P450 n=1 Tax=Ophiobolus disseminans TaxID=1469910 RepID=A0A6A6ZZK9_9PLEO|nr:cytochrome P450 [Ophiobolus disseminans]